MATPKSARIWKQRQPTSLRSAMELSLDFARARHNRSTERVADLMGLAGHWTLYKWIESGRLPAILIRSFENACGINLVSAFIAHSSGRLLIDVPTGKRATSTDIVAVQSAFADAMGQLLKFHGDQADADTTIAALTILLEQLAWHRGTVERSRQPQLDFNATEGADD